MTLRDWLLPDWYPSCRSGAQRRAPPFNLGTFQALKHRAVDCLCWIELARAIVIEALRTSDSGDKTAARLVSTAKAHASDVSILPGEEGIQLHGGIGTTDGEDIGLFLKRTRAAEQTLGDAGYHRDRFARLGGYWADAMRVTRSDTLRPVIEAACCARGGAIK